MEEQDEALLVVIHEDVGVRYVLIVIPRRVRSRIEHTATDPAVVNASEVEGGPVSRDGLGPLHEDVITVVPAVVQVVVGVRRVTLVGRNPGRHLDDGGVTRIRTLAGNDFPAVHRYEVVVNPTLQRIKE